MKRRRSAAAAELTPLLDVIMIMLFMVMMRNSGAAQKAIESAEERAGAAELLAAEAEERAAEAEESAGELSAQLDAAAGLLDGYEVLDSYVEEVVVTLSGQRQLTVTVKGEDTAVIDFDQSTVRYAENSLRNSLENIVRDADGAPVVIVFSYDSGTVLQRDYRMSAGVIDGIQGRNGNVYIQYSERGEEGERT